MSFLLRLKHWQLFLLVIGIPFVLQIISLTTIIVAQDPAIFLKVFPVLMIFFMGTMFGWFYALGTNLHKKLPNTVNMNLTRFKIFLFFPVVYMLFIFIILFGVFSNMTSNEGPPLWPMALILPLHFFSMFCIFYCLYFNAKSLKSVELQREVTFNDYAGEFFLLWFFPIGIWILQPRINNMFDND